MRMIKRITIISGLLNILFFTMLGSLSAQILDSAGILEKNRKSVIAFVVMGEDKVEIARGTGFIIGKEMMVTNYHLVSQAKSAEGRDIEGKKVKIEGIISHDAHYDLAVLKINRKEPAIFPGYFDELKFNSPVYVIGGNEAGQLEMNEGKVINLVDFEPDIKTADTSISAPQSTSGGPVFDEKGELVGILTFPDGPAKFILPANLINNLNRAKEVTKFKKWKTEDYFATLDGAYLAAKLFIAVDSNSKAAKFLNKVIEFKPNDIDALIMLAGVYAKQRNYSSSISEYQKILKINPNLDNAHRELGLVNIRMLKWAEAVAPLEKAIELNLDNNKDLYSAIGQAYEKQRMFDKAVPAYEKFLEFNPQSPGEIPNNLGVCYTELKQFDKAVIAFQAAVKLEPQNLRLNEKLAKSLHDAGQYDEAAEVYMNLIKLSPKDAKVYFNSIVMMYDGAQMQDKAIEAAQKMVDMDPSNSDAIYNLGYMHVKKQNYQEAIEVFKKAIELRPDFDYAYMNLGYCYSQTKNYTEAVNAFSKLVEFMPENSDGWFNIGLNYMQQKKWNSAIEPLRKTIELRPDNGLAYYNLGIAYLNLKDNYSARDVHKQLLTIDPDLAARLQKFLR